MKFTIALLLVAGASVAFGQVPPNEIDQHMIKARNAAGTEFTDLLARLCVAPPPIPTTPVARQPGGRAAPSIPARETWYAEPAKVFDNLYFVGSKIHNSWALTSNEGIIILDTIFTYNSEEEIIGGLKKLGLDPAKIKYVIISHAHGDHDGGAKLLQDRFGAKVVMGGPDWDSIERAQTGFPEGKPRKDIVADDGQKITVGDASVTIVTTPGHTPGTLSMIFQVKDHGKPLTVAYSGGTAFNFPSTVPNFDIYIRSQQKMAAAAAAANATVLMSNHTEFDGATYKINMLQLRKPGQPHPFEVGKDAIARYFTVSGECAEAARLKLSVAQSAAVSH
ncbi:MAG TPA: MBL fold metallo-hydrolase [Bryobacteraceae bacterium]|jgi:metallo-beta-lactamase class B|nr:MBL fold metallo-hydrolase [Bryobacteraceae bacterium]